MMQTCLVERVGALNTSRIARATAWRSVDTSSSTELSELAPQSSIGTPSVLDLLELVFEYVSLASEPARSSVEPRGRVEALERLLESPTFEARTHARVEVCGAVEFDVQDPSDRASSGVGHVLDLGGGGVSISTRRPLPAGTQTTVRFVDRATDRTWSFPCRVAWSRRGEDPAMGLSFEGSPATPIL